MFKKRSFIIQLLLGIDTEERVTAPEPTLLPFLAAIAPESSLDFICYLSEGFAKGDFCPQAPWPVLGCAAFSTVSQRLPSLKNPRDLFQKHPNLEWFDKSAENTAEPDSWIMAGFDWLNSSHVPVRILDKDREERIIAASSFLEERSNNSDNNLAFNIHLLPMSDYSPSALSHVIRVVEHCIEENSESQWLLALAVSRLTAIVRGEHRQKVMELSRMLHSPWNSSLISLSDAIISGSPYSDVILAHPGVQQFYLMDADCQSDIVNELAIYVPAVLNEMIMNWGGAPPNHLPMERPSLFHRIRSSVIQTFTRSGNPRMTGCPPPDATRAETEPPEECPPIERTATRGLKRITDNPRRAQVGISAIDENMLEHILQHAFISGLKNEVSVWIGFGGAAEADTEFTEELFAQSDKHFITLQVFLIIGEELLCESISVPRKRSLNSTKAVFPLTVEEGKCVVSAKIVFMHEGRTLQAFQLTGVVSADVTEEMSKTTKFELTSTIVTHDFENLEGRNTYDSSVFVESNDNALCISKSGRGYRNLDGVGHRVRAVTHLLYDTSSALHSNHQSIDGESGSKLFRELAISGRGFFSVYAKAGYTDLIEATRIQIISTDPASYLPLEYVYSGPSPSSEATLCSQWKSALTTGLCYECKLEELDGNHRTNTICPLKFWGLSKVIERHISRGGSLKGYTNWIQRVESAGDEYSDRVLKVLFASSTEVPDKGFMDSATALKRIAGEYREVESWSDWVNAVETHSPNLIVCMPHNDVKGDHEELHIADGSPLRVDEVDYHHLVGSGASLPPEDGPMILLFGCQTGTSKLHPYLSFVNAFSIHGASIVVGMLSTVIAEEAPVILQEFMQLMEAGDGTMSLGDALLEVRRRVFARGLVIGLAVTGFGDADCVIS